MIRYKDFLLGKINREDLIELDDSNIYIRWHRKNFDYGNYIFNIIGRVPHDFDKDINIFEEKTNSLNEFLKYRRDNPFDGGVIRIFTVSGNKTNPISQLWVLFNKLKSAFPDIDFK